MVHALQIPCVLGTCGTACATAAPPIVLNQSCMNIHGARTITLCKLLKQHNAYVLNQWCRRVVAYTGEPGGILAMGTASQVSCLTAFQTRDVKVKAIGWMMEQRGK